MLGKSLSYSLIQEIAPLKWIRRFLRDFYIYFCKVDDINIIEWSGLIFRLWEHFELIAIILPIYKLKTIPVRDPQFTFIILNNKNFSL